MSSLPDPSTPTRRLKRAEMKVDVIPGSLPSTLVNDGCTGSETSDAESQSDDNDDSSPDASPSRSLDDSPMAEPLQGPELPENAILSRYPFDNEYSRTLFDAIDRLHSCGAGGYLSIPQVRSTERPCQRWLIVCS
jgi:hypothetical protein